MRVMDELYYCKGMNILLEKIVVLKIKKTLDIKGFFIGLCLNAQLLLYLDLQQFAQ